MPSPSLLLDVQMGYMYTMEYHSAAKKKEIMPFAWMDLEINIKSIVDETKTNI